MAISINILWYYRNHYQLIGSFFHDINLRRRMTYDSTSWVTCAQERWMPCLGRPLWVCSLAERLERYTPIGQDMEVWHLERWGDKVLLWRSVLIDLQKIFSIYSSQGPSGPAAEPGSTWRPATSLLLSALRSEQRRGSRQSRCYWEVEDVEGKGREQDPGLLIGSSVLRMAGLFSLIFWAWG